MKYKQTVWTTVKIFLAILVAYIPKIELHFYFTESSKNNSYKMIYKIFSFTDFQICQFQKTIKMYLLTELDSLLYYNRRGLVF